MCIDKNPPTRDEAMKTWFIVAYLQHIAIAVEDPLDSVKLFNNKILDECFEIMKYLVRDKCSDSRHCIKHPDCGCNHHAASLGPCDRCVSSFISKHTSNARFIKAVIHFGSLVKSKTPPPESDAEWKDFMAEVDDM